MVKFKNEAKETQARYGINKIEAFLLYFQKTIILINMTNQRRTISKTAKVGFFSPKNK